MNEETKEEILELLDSAQYNCMNIQKAPALATGLVPMIQKQINEAIKKIDPEYEPLN